MREYLSSHLKYLWRLFELICITKHYFIFCFVLIMCVFSFFPFYCVFILSFILWFSCPLYNLSFLPSFLYFSLLPFFFFLFFPCNPLFIYSFILSVVFLCYLTFSLPSFVGFCSTIHFNLANKCRAYWPYTHFTVYAFHNFVLMSLFICTIFV